jgi:dUTP pyrophosphatase
MENKKFDIKRNYKVQFKKLSPTAIVPTQGTIGSAGYDLYADIPDEIMIADGCSKMIPTGIAVALPKGTFGGLYARSGLACKEGLRPANCTGVIDESYRGEIKVCLHNDSLTSKTILPKQRIAQLIVQPYYSISFVEVNELDDTERGTGGFGSTGKA